MEKLSQLLGKIDVLDNNIKNEVRALKYSLPEGDVARRMSLGGGSSGVRRMSTIAKLTRNL